MVDWVQVFVLDWVQVSGRLPLMVSAVCLGTTLDLLKFPIINPTPYRMFRRRERLKEAELQMEDELPLDELRRLRDFSRQGYLIGEMGEGQQKTEEQGQMHL